MEIKINTEGLKNGTKPLIEKALSDLSKAKESLAKIKEMPKDFSKSSELSRIPSRISQLEENVGKMGTYIEDKVRKINEFEGRRESINRVNQYMYEVEMGGRFEWKNGQLVDHYPNQPMPDSNNPNPLNIPLKTTVNKNGYNPEQIAYEQTASKVTSGNVTYSTDPIIVQYGKKLKNALESFNPRQAMKNAKKTVNDFIGGVNKKKNELIGKAKNFNVEDAVTTIKNLNGADFTNLVFGAGKGVARFGEELSDGYQVMATNSFSGNPDVLYYYNNDIKTIEKGQKLLQRDTMAMVSEQHVENVYNNFYQNTEIGKYLNENANEDFKSDGKYVKWTEQRAHQGIIFLAGGSAGPLGVGVLGGMSAKGKTAEAMWVNNNVKSLIDNGADLDTLDSIYKKADTYSSMMGTYTGISMTFQKATGSGGKIDKIFDNPIKRILGDAVVGSTEPIVNSWAESKVTGNSFKETFKKNGGWSAVGEAASGAGFDSLVGELKRWGIGKVNKEVKDATGVDLLYEKAKLTTKIKKAFNNAVEDIIHPKDRIIANPEVSNLIDDFLDLEQEATEKNVVDDNGEIERRKQYVDLDNLNEIENMYGTMDDQSRLEVATLLKGARQRINSGELDGNENFYTYMMENITESNSKFNEVASNNTLMKRLTINEAQAIHSYTEGSGRIQKFLGNNVLDNRSGSPTEVEQMIDLIETIDSGLEKGGTLQQNQVFHRGMTWKQMEEWGLSNYDLLKEKEGTTIHVKNYISTGVTKEGAFTDREVVWRIRCDEGENCGAYINELSAYSMNTNEYEYLIKRGGELKIDNVERRDLLIDNPENGITYIDATVTGFKPDKIDKNNITEEFVDPASILIQ